MSHSAVIVDVDGTLARFDPHAEGRWVIGREKAWDAFFDFMKTAPAVEPVVRLVRLLKAQGETILICTGRPESHRSATETWLHAQEIPFDACYLRPLGADAVPDEDVKAQLYARIRADGHAPWLVLDDRDAVVAEWRALGLTCLQCAPGAY